MADDIDDLLDEVETKYCAKSKGKEKKISKLTSKKGADDDLDDILNDIPSDPAFKPLKKEDLKATNISRPESARKCFPVFLGGSMIAKGLTTTVNKKACDQIRCTSCDFRVASFDNFEWDTSTDYLFLRNNSPDFDRLKSKLISSRGCRAYCCQCRHQSVKDTMAVNNLDLKWVCGKH